eukprot:TRINITY_DN515_c0_g1_i3.p1 TRINITY_DN515_c0_g1~~TRINITY_DN515_c0_g1_i3.p1  ORF type:complete len:1428 (-),score=387.83 TRINITY_DN515_c0_g1_i3:50-4333(-)
MKKFAPHLEEEDEDDFETEAPQKFEKRAPPSKAAPHKSKAAPRHEEEEEEDFEKEAPRKEKRAPPRKEAPHKSKAAPPRYDREKFEAKSAPSEDSEDDGVEQELESETPQKTLQVEVLEQIEIESLSAMTESSYGASAKLAPKQDKPGFFSRLFGSFRKDKQTAKSAAPAPPPPPAVQKSKTKAKAKASPASTSLAEEIKQSAAKKSPSIQQEEQEEAVMMAAASKAVATTKQLTAGSETRAERVRAWITAAGGAASAGELSSSAAKDGAPSSSAPTMEAYKDRARRLEQLCKRQKSIRPFLSSTFRDFHEERRILNTEVAPKLRKLCAERDLFFAFLDLRWGITDEQAGAGKVIELCLREIENCRPWFIAMLGARYGWCHRAATEPLDSLLQANFDTALKIPAFSWISDFRDRSVTELEIRAAMRWDDEEVRLGGLVLCTQRSDAYVATLPAEEQSVFAEENPRFVERLAALKRDLGLKHTVHEYSSPPAIAELVHSRVAARICELFPLVGQLSPLDTHSLSHMRFAQSRAALFVGGQRHHTSFQAFLESDRPALLVRGESGMGKSALMASFVQQVERHAGSGALVLSHFVGATSQSTDHIHLIQRITEECQLFCAATKTTESTGESDAAESMRLWLGRAGQIAPVYLILDAVNQLEDVGNAWSMQWLPVQLPAGVRAVVSTLPGRCETNLRLREWPEIVVDGFSSQDRREFAVKYLEQYGKSLLPDQVDLLVGARQTANPLFLKVVLEEIVAVGVHDSLNETMMLYLHPETLPQLFVKVLTRWEEDYGLPDGAAAQRNIVGEVLGLIYVSRRGLSQQEVWEALGLAPVAVAPLFNSTSEFLRARSGDLLNFFHDALRIATASRYLSTPESRIQAHRTLAKYFLGTAQDARRCDELPFHLKQSGDAEKLAEVLLDFSTFEYVYPAFRYDLLEYWRFVEASGASAHKPGDYLTRLTSQSESGSGISAALAQKVGLFMLELKQPALAEKAFKLAIQIAESNSDSSDHAGQVALAEHYYHLGEAFQQQFKDDDQNNALLQSYQLIPTSRRTAFAISMRNFSAGYLENALKFLLLVVDPLISRPLSSHTLELLQALTEYGYVLLATAKPANVDLAVLVFVRAKALAVSAFGLTHPTTVRVSQELGFLYLQLRQDGPALEELLAYQSSIGALLVRLEALLPKVNFRAMSLYECFGPGLYKRSETKLEVGTVWSFCAFLRAIGDDTTASVLESRTSDGKVSSEVAGAFVRDVNDVHSRIKGKSQLADWVVYKLQEKIQRDQGAAALRTPLAEIPPAVTFSAVLAIGNAYRRLSGKFHHWRLVVEGLNTRASDVVRQCVFHLHPTFNPSVLTLTKEPFHLQRVGWGYFEVTIDLHFHSIFNAPVVTLTHMLTFRPGGAFKLYDLRFVDGVVTVTERSACTADALREHERYRAF